MRVWMKWLRYS